MMRRHSRPRLERRLREASSPTQVYSSAESAGIVIVAMATNLFDVPLGTAPNDPERTVGVSPIPAEALAYRGQWVAIRGGKVVAARPRLSDLYQAPETKDSDVTYHVPARATVAFQRSA